jgi:hypothetical protein
MKINRFWATPLTAGSFILSAVTGVLLLLHLDRGLNHWVHEWLSLVLLVGVAFHMTSHIHSLKGHLQTVIGVTIIGTFIVVLLLSCIQIGEATPEPKWRSAVSTLSTMPIEDLAEVIDSSSEQIAKKLHLNGIEITSTKQTIKDLVGTDPESQLHALNLFLPSHAEH